MPEFNRARRDTAGTDATRATACLPGLGIEIAQRRAIKGDAEQISISLGAAPSFEAFGPLEAANPFGFWAQAAQLAWKAWLGAASGLAAWTLALPQPSGGASSSPQERRSPGPLTTCGTVHLCPP